MLANVRTVSLNAALAAALSLAIAPPARSDDAAAELARQGVGFLKDHCSRCHGEDGKKNKGLNVFDRTVLTRPHDEGEAAYVVPGKPEDSAVWQRAGVERDMPEKGKKPSDAELETFRRWIEAGAPFPEVGPAAPFINDAAIMAAISQDLGRAPQEDRPFLRYFTLTHLANLKAIERGRSLDEADLELARAALSKAINSLSWQRDIVVPTPIDDARTIFRIDTRDLDWDEPDVWALLLKSYPYGLNRREVRDPTTRQVADDLDTRAGGELHWIRGDWFIVHATQGELYRLILRLPATAGALERIFGIDFPANFRKGRIARAGFNRSKISKQNRMVERQKIPHGAYWKSYDFRPGGDDRGQLTRSPLGPEFAGHPFPALAFQHAGGEIIFNLPNGLQGYMLVDGQGRRIDRAPIDIVADENQYAGTPEIVNGLSCIACHRQGVLPLADTIREAAAVDGQALRKVQELYVRPEKMQALLAVDEARFREALAKAVGPALGPRAAATDGPEPIARVAAFYLRDLSIAAVAAELGLAAPETLLEAIRNNPKLQEQGLGVLAAGEPIARARWEAVGESLYQQVARELGLGIPLRVNLTR